MDNILESFDARCAGRAAGPRGSASWSGGRVHARGREDAERLLQRDADDAEVQLLCQAQQWPPLFATGTKPRHESPALARHRGGGPRGDGEEQPRGRHLEGDFVELGLAVEADVVHPPPLQYPQMRPRCTRACQDDLLRSSSKGQGPANLLRGGAKEAAAIFSNALQQGPVRAPGDSEIWLDSWQQLAPSAESAPHSVAI
mmetsp:Transcript_67184/g.170357  ORF Transcript_67184/g.170357 Transcript_67184/m.170357 type:complete len:200 (+) Transcript_67184:839-1438(+)